MDIPSTPSGWGLETLKLMTDQGHTLETAVEHVSLRYLREGDCRPLFDAALREYSHSSRVLMYLAAMINADCRASHPEEVRFQFVFKPIGARRPRSSRKPKQTDARRLAALEYQNILLRGMNCLAKGRNPHITFWRDFYAMLEPDYRKELETKLNKAFHWAAKVRRIGGSRGRRLDPEIETRDEVLASLVDRENEQVKSYKRAVGNVTRAVNDQWREESASGLHVAPGWLNERTVRNAFDPRTKAKPSK